MHTPQHIFIFVYSGCACEDVTILLGCNGLRVVQI